MQSETQLQQQFEECVQQCADSLYRVAYRLTGNRTLALELVQETYLNAWKSLPNLKDSNKMRSWLFAIMRNQFSKLLHKEKRNAQTIQQLSTIPTSSDKPDNDTTDRVQTALQTLDDIHRLPVLLVSLEGMSVDEAAGILDVPRGTVLSRLHRGRAKLKEILSRDDFHGEAK